jgi:chemotaxis protein MotB
MARKKKEKSGGEGGGWIVTYADLVTLLFAFFVLLYAFSSVNEETFRKIALSLSSALNGSGTNGVVENVDGAANSIVEFPMTSIAEKRDREKYKITQEFEAIKEEFGLDDEITITTDGLNVRVDINSTTIFPGNSAVIRPEFEEVLVRISEVLIRLDREVEIEGHTARSFLIDEYPTYFHLASARGLSVALFMMDNGVEEELLTIKAFGANEPVAPNDTEENLSKNRRVSVLIKYRIGGF